MEVSGWDEPRYNKLDQRYYLVKLFLSLGWSLLSLKNFYIENKLIIIAET